MIRFIRICGLMMILAGALMIMVFLISPLRFLWVAFQNAPPPIQIGLGVALGGFILIMSSLIWERIGERETDRALREDALWSAQPLKDDKEKPK